MPASLLVLQTLKNNRSVYSCLIALEGLSQGEGFCAVAECSTEYCKLSKSPLTCSVLLFYLIISVFPFSASVMCFVLNVVLHCFVFNLHSFICKNT